LPIICNADDSTQIVAPFGVREALTLLGVQTGSTSLLRAATAASESHSVAPPKSSSACSDSDTDCGNGETCVNGKDPDGDGDCTSSGTPGGKCSAGQTNCVCASSGKCTCSDADHDCGIGPNGQPEVCSNGADPDGDSDCTVCSDTDRDCGKLPSGASEVCTNGTDPDADADCVSQVTALAAKTTLPFTGENVLEVLLVGLALTGGGLALANRNRRPLRRRK
jgi:hypothetical protein